MAKRDTRLRAVIPVEKCVATGYWRLGTGESYRSTSVTFGVGKSTALNIVHDFVQALFQVREDFVSVIELNCGFIDINSQKCSVPQESTCTT